MNKLTDDQILTAIAQLKKSEDSKVKVTELAKKLGVTSKTLYTSRYKHLLEYCKPGVAVTRDNNTLLSELMSTKNLLKKNQDELENLKNSLDKERKDMKRSTLSDLFFQDCPAFELEQIKQEINGKTAQLNTKVNKIGVLEIKLVSYESKIQDLEETIKTKGVGSNKVEYTFFKPGLFGANEAYLSDKKLSSWVNKYKDACEEKILEIISKDFKQVILHISNFNCKTEDVCKHVNYAEGKYAAIHIALHNSECRANLITKLTKEKIKIFCIYTISTSAVAKMYCLKDSLPIDPTLIDKLENQFQAPGLNEGFSDIYTRVITNG